MPKFAVVGVSIVAIVVLLGAGIGFRYLSKQPASAPLAVGGGVVTPAPVQPVANSKSSDALSASQVKTGGNPSLIFAIPAEDTSGKAAVYHYNENSQEAPNRVALIPLRVGPAADLWHTYDVASTGELFYINGNEVRVLDIATGKERTAVTGLMGAVVVISVRSDGKKVLINGYPQNIGSAMEHLTSYDVASGQRDWSIDVPVSGSWTGRYCRNSQQAGVIKAAFPNNTGTGEATTQLAIFTLQFYGADGKSAGAPVTLSQYKPDAETFNQQEYFADKVSPDCNRYIEYIENKKVEGNVRGTEVLVDRVTGIRTPLHERRSGPMGNDTDFTHPRFSEDGNTILVERFGILWRTQFRIMWREEGN